MLILDDISFSIAGRPLIEHASVTIPQGHKVGIVGRNGTGKTTLFKAIQGEIPLETGRIDMARGARLGGVAQEAPATRDSLLDTVLMADLERASLLSEAETASDPMRIAEIQTRLADIESHSAEARAASLLQGLGFNADAQARACEDFSGGWRMRVALAAVLFSRPDVLLLDEPTNYLDLEGTVWLEQFLTHYPATTLIISHDRTLLNRSVQAILHLEQKRLRLYGGRYDQFEEERRLQIERDAAHARKQDAQRAHIQSFVDRFRYKASKAKQAQARLKMLERMQPVNALVESAVAGFNFPNPEAVAPPMMVADKVAIGYEGKPVLKSIKFRMDQEDRIALLGANGQGKSTLSKLIAGKLAPLEGTFRGSGNLRIGYFAQHQMDELVEQETAYQHFHRLFPDELPAKIRSRLASAGIGADIAMNKVCDLSGGQKARLLMAMASIDAPHVLILDEPTNHLDIESREALVQALAAYEGAVVIVSHDPHLVESVADRLWLVHDGKVDEFDGDMDDYRRLLLSHRGSMGDGGKQKSGDDVKAKKRRSAADIRKQLAPLKANLSKCEERVEKLEEMREKIDALLADPELYASGDSSKIEGYQKKRGEILAGIERAETLWMEAEASYEEAKAELEA